MAVCICTFELNIFFLFLRVKRGLKGNPIFLQHVSSGCMRCHYTIHHPLLSDLTSRHIITIPLPAATSLNSKVLGQDEDLVLGYRLGCLY